MDNSKIEPLVSLIIPCYNVEKKINRLLDSLLEQTYKRLQLIFVNDGSTDNTEGVILANKEILEKQGYEVDVICKENGGLGSAVNCGLKFVKGDYFCWPDADDFLALDSVEKKLLFLEEHKEYGAVRSDAALYFEHDLSNPIGTITRGSKNRFKDSDLMEDYILENDAILCPGCHMARTQAFRSMLPNMDIYEGRGGQNHQLLLPLVYKYKFGYIDECLYNYIIYSDSMTQRYKTYDELVGKCGEGELYISETLKRIDMPKTELDYYLELTHQKYIVRRALLAFDFGNKKLYKSERRKVVDSRFANSLHRSDVFYYIPGMFWLNHQLYLLKGRLKRHTTLYGFLKRNIGIHSQMFQN